jgi:hypothetical protein
MSFSFALNALWGLCVLAAFVGWGSALASSLYPKHRADMGLRAAWGLALSIAAGGFVAMLGLATRSFVLAWTAAGAAWSIVDAWHHRDADLASRLRNALTGRLSVAVLALLCALAAAIQYLYATCSVQFNPNDDFVAYFPFVRQILETGTLVDTFSTRRVMSLGGHSLLQALAAAGSAGFRLHVLDRGICMLVVLLLALGAARPGRILPALLAAVVVLTLPDIRVNTYAQMSGVAVFFGLYRTLVWLDERDDVSAARAAIAVALLGSAACTLRSNYIAVVVPMLAISYAAAIVGQRRSPERKALREMLYAAALSFLFLVPWMSMSYRSSGTPLFPLFRGHFNDAFPMMGGDGNWGRVLRDLIGTATHNRLLPAFWLFLGAGLLLPDRRTRRPLLALLVSCVIGWVLLVHTLASDIPSFARYVYGFYVAAVLAVTTNFGAGLESASRWRRAGGVLAICALAVQIALVAAESIEAHDWMAEDVRWSAPAPTPPPAPAAAVRAYSEMQARVPAGETLLVMVDYPFLLDYRRNRILNLDTAAAVSPPPGFPYFRGAEAIAAYLRQQSIRYFAFVPSDSALSLFRRSAWENELHDPDAYWHAQAPVYLDLFDNIERLASTHAQLYRDKNVVLLDLARPAIAQNAVGQRSCGAAGFSPPSNRRSAG